MSWFIFISIIVFLTSIRVFLGTDEFDDLFDHEDDEYELPDYCYKSSDEF